LLSNTCSGMFVSVPRFARDSTISGTIVNGKDKRGLFGEGICPAAKQLGTSLASGARVRGAG
jgi:hypothetical protein